MRFVQKTFGNIVRLLLKATTASILLLFLAPNANAAIVYSQTPTPNGLNFGEAPTGTCCLTADDFVLTLPSTTINKVFWVGAMAPDETPAPVDDFTINFYEDNGSGKPGTLIQSFAVGHADRVENGVITDINGDHLRLEHSANLGAGVTLGPGTYWISIFNNTTDNNVSSKWFWAVDATAANVVGANIWQSNNGGTTWTINNLPHTMFFSLEFIDPTPMMACYGFFSPFDVPLTFKKKSKRAIPVKMILLDEFGNVMTDSNLGAPPVVQVTVEEDQGSGIGGYDGDLLPNGLSDDSNEFRYDPLEMQWIINLGTKQYTSSQTYTVRALAGDSSYEIDPTCSQTFTRE